MRQLAFQIADILSALWRVHLPLLVPALGAAGLLVFVDGMKELPATLLLRPFNFETLATHVYSYAALEQFESAALGPDKKSLAIQVTLQPRDKTLTDEEIDAVGRRIVAEVTRATGGSLRT